MSFASAIEDTESLIVPTICLTEVFKMVARQRGEGDALQAIAVMQQGRLVIWTVNWPSLLQSSAQTISSRLPTASSSRPHAAWSAYYGLSLNDRM